jgi:hypothetical protein
MDGNAVVGISDSGAFCDDNVQVREDSKQHIKHIEGIGRVLIGISGTFSVLQWIINIDWPACQLEDDTYASLLQRYLVVQLQPFLQKSVFKRFKKHATPKAQEEGDSTDWNLLIGVPGCGIFTLYANGDVEKAWDPKHVMAHACIGSGGIVADACIKTLKVTSSSFTSWEMLDLAASAAFQSISSVRGPFTTKYLMA